MFPPLTESIEIVDSRGMLYSDVEDIETNVMVLSP